MAQTQIIDTSTFHDYVGNNKAEVEFMINLFTEQSSTYYTELEIAYTHDDTIEWHDVAHKLKGMALFTGAHQLHQTCTTAQDSYQSSKQDKFLLLKKIETDIEKTISFFKHYQEGE